MGSLILPSSGPVYADALIFIYSVEKHPIYALTLRPLWEAVARGDLEVLSSELTLIETLIGPLKQGDAALETDYENFFASPGIRLLPITSSILRAGARLCATLSVYEPPMPFKRLPAILAVARSSSRMTSSFVASLVCQLSFSTMC